MNLEWVISIVAEKPQERSWGELIKSLQLIFDKIKVWIPNDFIEKGWGDMILTDNKETFVYAKEHGFRCILLPTPMCRIDFAEFIKSIAFSFLTEDAFSKMQ